MNSMTIGTAKLFQPWSHCGLSLRTRVVMAPMTRRMAAEDGIPTEAMADYYARRAALLVGLIVSEGTAVDGKHAYDSLTVPRFETPEQLEGWKRVVEAVHREGGAFAPQLWHTGPRAVVPLGPSAAPSGPARDGSPRPDVREMSRSDMDRVVEIFARCARHARGIGADALEVHGAHGYLLDAFLDPSGNRRTDSWGGSLENRMRFPLEVLRAVRGAVGPGFPVIYRFSQWENGLPESRKFHGPGDLGIWVRALGEAGADILHVSVRDATAPGFPARGEKTLAGWTRELSGLPVIAVGKVSLTLPMDRAYGEAPDTVLDPAPAIDLVERGEADLLAVGRALIPNPDWVLLVRDGRWRELIPFHKSLLETLR
jgi:2,4-dienoyl-CoA reductase-like NADH-dependent reductase (Old Yellow Enzyme family)